MPLLIYTNYVLYHILCLNDYNKTSSNYSVKHKSTHFFNREGLKKKHLRHPTSIFGSILLPF